jgi:hypothetical protein
MQLPISPDPKANKNLEIAGRAAFSFTGLSLSVESQLKLKELYQFVEVCRAVLGEIRTDLVLFESNPEDPSYRQKASEKLGYFCIEADSWGFNSLYEIGFGLQMLLIDSCRCPQADAFWDILNRGVAMLSDLVEQCEFDFRWRLAIADMLDSIRQLSRN